MNIFEFPIWLESRENRPIVFCDLDETLCHSMETKWLKDSPSNKNFIKMIIPGENPYPNVKEIKTHGKNLYIFPRPGASSFIKNVNNFADFFILSHNNIDYIEKVVDSMGWNKNIKKFYSTGQLKPGQLSKEYNLKEKKWILIDNLHIHSIEVCNKFRILGLGDDQSNPHEAIKKIVSQADKHFVKIKDWIPTVDQYDDFELWAIIQKIKQKFEL
jgi:hypothetical protein